MIAIVDYRAGNLTSVRLALEHLGLPAHVTWEPREIAAAERVIFPGVGAAGSAMKNLAELGLSEVLRGVVERGTPFLGICLGTQVIFEHSEEDGGVDCLSIVPGRVRKFTPSDPLCKIPQMGWNTIDLRGTHPLFEGIENESEFYFVHSYYPVPSDLSYIFAETEYAGARFASVIAKGNLAATQFHPERSGRLGLRLLENFSKWDGSC